MSPGDCCVSVSVKHRTSQHDSMKFPARPAPVSSFPGCPVLAQNTDNQLPNSPTMKRSPASTCSCLQPRSTVQYTISRRNIWLSPDKLSPSHHHLADQRSSAGEP